MLYGVGGLRALAVLGAGAALVIVDGNFVKTRLEARHEGEEPHADRSRARRQLRLFPVAGIALGKTTLSEPGSDKPFVSLDSAEVAVRTMPLLSGEVASRRSSSPACRANVVRRKDGTMNFSDLVEPKDKDKKPEAPPNLRLAEVNVEKVQLSYRDEATRAGTERRRTEPEDRPAGRQHAGRGGAVGADHRQEARGGPARAGDGRACASIWRKEEFAFDKFSAQLKGRYDQDTVAAEFSRAQGRRHARQGVSGSEVKVSIQIKGPQRNVDARLLIAAMEGSATALAIPKVSLDLDRRAGAGSPRRRSSRPSIKANLAKQDLDARRSAARWTKAR